MIAAAFEIRILKVTPSFEEAQKELGEIGAKSGYKPVSYTHLRAHET